MALWSEAPFESVYLEPSKNGINRPRSTRGSGYKMINMGELFAYGRIKNPEMELVPLNEEEKQKYGVQEGDLLFARQSLVKEGAGKCSIVMSVPETTCFEGHLIRVRLDKSKAEPLYYYYYFSSYEGKGNVQSLVMQVAAAGIRGSELAKLNIPHPPLPTQRRIADILSAYDDLIENNTRRIHILEQMAQAVYQEWFGKVDKESLSEGWEVKSISDLCEFISRGVTPKYTEGSQRFIINQKANRGSFIDTANLKELKPDLHVPEGKFARVEDVLINSLGEGTLGRVHYFLGPDNEWAVDQHMTICRSSTPGATLLTYFYLSSDEGQARIESLKTGGTNMTMFNISEVRQFELIVPPENLLKDFYDLITPFWKMKRTLELKNANLRQTRDLLLPRLVSGEVEV